MMRTLTALGTSLSLLLTVSHASAQTRGELGQKGQFIISADRLFSLFSYSHISQDRFVPAAGNSKVTDTTSQSSISLLWGATGPSGVNGDVVVNPFAVPRVGFDYVVAPNFTVGGDLAIFFTLGGSSDQQFTANNGTTTSNSTGTPSVLVFGIAPRAGYVLRVNDLFAFWLRGGLSYYVENTKNGGVSGSRNQGALDLDPQFVVTPIPHVGFTAGLSLDVPIAGGHSQDVPVGGGTQSVSASSSILFFGITMGMIAYF
jgi:hypothetical protein